MVEDGVIVGRIFKVPIAPQDRPWMWARPQPPHPTRRPIRADARGRDGGVRKEAGQPVCLSLILFSWNKEWNISQPRASTIFILRAFSYPHRKRLLMWVGRQAFNQGKRPSWKLGRGRARSAAGVRSVECVNFRVAPFARAANSLLLLPPEDAPDFVEVGEAGIAVDHAMRRQRRVQLVG